MFCVDSIVWLTYYRHRYYSSVILIIRYQIYLVHSYHSLYIYMSVAYKNIHIYLFISLHSQTYLYFLYSQTISLCFILFKSISPLSLSIFSCFILFVNLCCNLCIKLQYWKPYQEFSL